MLPRGHVEHSATWEDHSVLRVLWLEACAHFRSPRSAGNAGAIVLGCRAAAGHLQAVHRAHLSSPSAMTLWSKAPDAVSILLFFDLAIKTVSSEKAMMSPVPRPSGVPGTQWE